ncbi:MAG: hypothetical protein HDS16_04855 [Bacteroides sp.]|nr:hypothetical protein [Bacteroides sp.]
MKTIADLLLLAPTLSTMILEANSEIGWSGLEYDEESGSVGTVDHYEPNQIEYCKDGWDIGVDYECCGIWDKEFGLQRYWYRLKSIEAGYCDPDSGEEYIFSPEELEPIAQAVISQIE